MLFEKTYGIDLGSSSVKVYSMIRNKSYIEKNMIAANGLMEVFIHFIFIV